ncbi:MAG: Glu/Leu/Phe/Val dehydrogenase dimerization domain-containing protein [Pseudomonadota bacterium]
MPFDSGDFDAHERVLFVADRPSGLRAIVAIHDTRLGPAIGGCRARAYASEAEAVADVLRLSRGMTYKAACSGLPFGGGKSVVLLRPGQSLHAGMLRALGGAIEQLRGDYITGEDMGTSSQDMATLREVTRHVMGAPADLGGSGDPSASTAFGCLVGMRAAVRRRFGRETLRGLRVAVQGLGHVGWRLCELLATEGAVLLVADVREDIVRRAEHLFGATAVPSDRIAQCEADVYAPCALGGTLDETSIAQLQAGVVAGAANNQLRTAADADRLAARGILYAPDYVINAGGMVQLGLEHLGRLRELQPRLQGIGDTLEQVFADAERHGTSTAAAADALAQERLAAAGAPRG